MNRIRIRVLPLDELDPTQKYLVISVSSDAMSAFTRPGILEYLDDESGTWVPVPIEVPDVVTKQVNDLREMSGEVPIQVPRKN